MTTATSFPKGWQSVCLFQSHENPSPSLECWGNRGGSPAGRSERDPVNLAGAVRPTVPARHRAGAAVLRSPPRPPWGKPRRILWPSPDPGKGHYSLPIPPPAPGPEDRVPEREPARADAGGSLHPSHPTGTPPAELHQGPRQFRDPIAVQGAIDARPPAWPRVQAGAAPTGGGGRHVQAGEGPEGKSQGRRS